MFRRDFLKNCGFLSVGTFLAYGETFKSFAEAANSNELYKHKINCVEFGQIQYNFPRLVGKNARKGLHGKHKQCWYTKICTNQGACGWGLTTAPGKHSTMLKETLLGKTLDQVFVPSVGIAEGVNPRFDIALHDLAGIILNLPVYKILGATGPKETRIYSGMIYFDELKYKGNPGGINTVMKNCRWDYDYGYRQLKVKIGRSGKWYEHDKGLAMDIEIVRMIHDEFGDEVDILVDANDMYSLDDTIAFLKGVEGVPIYWMEEPFIESIEDGRKLKDWMMANGRKETRYADGERAPKIDVCMKLAKEGKLDVFLADIFSYGMTPWQRLMPSLNKTNTSASPHTWGNRLKTNYTAHLAAGLGNVCTIEGVTCISDDIDYGDYKIIDGKIQVSEKPGFGMKILNTK